MNFEIKKKPFKRLILAPVVTILFIALFCFMSYDTGDAEGYFFSAMFAGFFLWLYPLFLKNYLYYYTFSDMFVTAKTYLGKVYRFNYSDISYEHRKNQYILVSKLNNKTILVTETDEELKKIEGLIGRLDIETVQIKQDFNDHLNMPLMVIRQDMLEPVVYEKSMKRSMAPFFSSLGIIFFGDIYLLVANGDMPLWMWAGVLFIEFLIVAVAFYGGRQAYKEMPERIEFREDAILVKYFKDANYKEVPWSNADVRWSAYQYDEDMVNLTFVLHFDDGSSYAHVVDKNTTENMEKWNQVLRLLTVNNKRVDGVYGVHEAEGQAIEKYRENPLVLKKKESAGSAGGNKSGIKLKRKS